MSIENPELKQDIEKINKEGWEDNAAVRIGKKEDMPNMIKALETEGKAEDVATYIRLNKQIIISAEDVSRLDSKLRIPTAPEPGMYFFGDTSSDLSKFLIYFFDKNLNLAKFEINARNNKISSLEKEANSQNWSRYLDKIKDEITQLGFKKQSPDISASMEILLGDYQREIINTSKEKTSKEFDF